jgi:hypothetical protein
MMELLLNLVWAAFSILLVGIWFCIPGSAHRTGRRQTAAQRQSRTLAQMLALAIVVLLLLPAISMSDDLMAAQGPAETDASLRRPVDSDLGHHSLPPTSFALPEPVTEDVYTCGLTEEALLIEGVALPASFHSSALDCRPPPLS